MFSVKTTVGVLLLLTALLSVPMAYATPTPTRSISGKFTVTSYMVTSTQLVGGNTIISWNATAVSVGDVSGNYVTTGVQFTRPDGSGRGTEYASFTGSVFDRTGTFLGVSYQTWGSDGLCNPRGLCRGTLTDGTGDLRHIHGVLLWNFPFGNDTGVYSGHVHFGK